MTQTIYFNCDDSGGIGNLTMTGYDPVCDIALCADNEGGTDDVHFHYGAGLGGCSDTRYDICRTGSPGSYVYSSVIPDNCCTYDCCCGYAQVVMDPDSGQFTSCYNDTAMDDCEPPGAMTYINGKTWTFDLATGEVCTDDFWQCDDTIDDDSAFTANSILHDARAILQISWDRNANDGLIIYLIQILWKEHSVSTYTTSHIRWTATGSVEDCAALPTNIPAGDVACDGGCPQSGRIEGGVDLVWSV